MLCAVLLSLLLGPVVFAGAEPLQPPPQTQFSKGKRELDLTAGYWLSPLMTHKRPTFNYVQENVSLGWMLSDPSGSSLLRGNFEFLVNVFGAEVIKGSGSWLTGGRLLLRYNFVQPEARIVPFITLGAGGLYNDVHRDHSQSIIGGAFEFSLVGEMGMRYFLRPNLALILSGNFEHISNAGTAARNVGCNSLGGQLGLGFFF